MPHQCYSLVQHTPNEWDGSWEEGDSIEGDLVGSLGWNIILKQIEGYIIKAGLYKRKDS